MSIQRTLLFFLFFSLLSSVLFAGTPSPPPELFRPKIDFRIEVDEPADFKDSSARVGVSSQALRASYFGFYLGYRVSRYSWRKADLTDFLSASSSPWEHLHSASFGFRSMFPVGEGRLVNAGIGLNTSFERQLSGSAGCTANLMLIQMLNENWSSGLGVVMVYDPLKLRVLPAIALRYDGEVDQKGVSGSFGMPAQIKYRINEEWRLFGNFGFSSGTYRLKDNSRVEKKGYFRHSSLSPRFGVEYFPWDNMELEAAGVYKFEREWRIYSRSGSRRHRSRLDNGIGLAVNFSWRF